MSKHGATDDLGIGPSLHFHVAGRRGGDDLREVDSRFPGWVRVLELVLKPYSIPLRVLVTQIILIVIRVAGLVPVRVVV